MGCFYSLRTPHRKIWPALQHAASRLGPTPSPGAGKEGPLTISQSCRVLSGLLAIDNTDFSCESLSLNRQLQKSNSTMKT